MKAAEHMAIRFALERYSKGEVKVNAVHQMMEHMSRQMDSLRQILKLQEEKMNKAGILVESHADILDRMFWAEVPESGKKTVLMSNEAPCVPPRNLRQFVEVLLDRDDKQTSAEILNNYSGCLATKEAEPRRKTAIGLSQLADLYSRLGGEAMGKAIHTVSEQLCVEKDPELQSLLSAAFVRLSQEASEAKNYQAVNAVCAGMELLLQQRPVLVNDLRPRVGVENRIPEFIEEALHSDPVPRGVAGGVAAHVPIGRRTSGRPLLPLHAPGRVRPHGGTGQGDGKSGSDATAGDSAHRAAAAGLGGSGAVEPSGCGYIAGAVAGALAGVEPLLPRHCGSPDRHTEPRQTADARCWNLAEVLDSAVLPESIDEIGMSGDLYGRATAAGHGQAGRIGFAFAVCATEGHRVLGKAAGSGGGFAAARDCGDEENFWLGSSPRVADCGGAVALEDRSALQRQILSDSGIEPAELAIAPLDTAPACPWVRQRRYERMVLPRTISATIGSSWGKSKILIRELSLGGGMGTKEDNLRIGSEADLEISVGMRSKIKAHVLLRRARINEVGFEIVNTDLESRYRLRRLLVEALNHAPQNKDQQWSGERS